MPDIHARKILMDLLSLPTAPFAEHAIVRYVEETIADMAGVTSKRDRAGNILIHASIGKRTFYRPICLTAHMDHPGFVAEKMVSRSTVRAHWRGGVMKEYFAKSKVRFYVEGEWHKGTIRKVYERNCDGHLRVFAADINVDEEIPPGSIGMWDFPDPRVRKGRVYARGCDDLAGVAALLSSLKILVRSQTPCDVYYLLTRAEEVGFVGAIAAAKDGTVPRHCVVVTMETSSARINAKLDDGPILRVGDKSTTFSPTATAYCELVAKHVAQTNKKFIYQRKLMDGGTCESSVFCNAGYDATGICVALGNYHNMNQRKRKIAAEFISLSDYDGVVLWFTALAQGEIPYQGKDTAFLERMQNLEASYAELLARTVDQPE